MAGQLYTLTSSLLILSVETSLRVTSGVSSHCALQWLPYRYIQNNSWACNGFSYLTGVQSHGDKQLTCDYTPLSFCLLPSFSLVSIRSIDQYRDQATAINLFSALNEQLRNSVTFTSSKAMKLLCVKKRVNIPTFNGYYRKTWTMMYILFISVLSYFQ